MNNSRSSLKSKIILSVLIFLCCAMIVINISLAIFGNRQQNTGIIQFAQHKLDIEITDSDSIILKPDELILGSNAKRTINIVNPANSTSCVLRMKLEFYIEDVLTDDYLSFEIAGSLFSLNDTNNYYYYNGVLATGGKIQNLVLNFKVSDSVDEGYQGKHYNIKLYIESIQATKDAVSAWKDEYTPEWYSVVKNSLV